MLSGDFEEAAVSHAKRQPWSAGRVPTILTIHITTQCFIRCIPPPPPFPPPLSLPPFINVLATKEVRSRFQKDASVADWFNLQHHALFGRVFDLLLPSTHKLAGSRNLKLVCDDLLRGTLSYISPYHMYNVDVFSRLENPGWFPSAVKNKGQVMTRAVLNATRVASFAIELET